MSDPRSDPRAQQLLRADPGTVTALANLFSTVATTSQHVGSGLQAARDQGTWTGQAATAFRNGLGKLPADLDKVTTSYQQAGDALHAYEGVLSSTQAAFKAIASQLATAQTAVNNAQTALDHAQSAVTSAQNAHPLAPLAASVPTTPISVGTPSPLRINALQGAVTAASGTLGGAQAEFEHLATRGFQLLDQFSDARTQAGGRISSASHVPPHREWWQTALHDVGDVMADIGKFAWGIVKGVGGAFTGLPSAIANFVEHPSWETFGKLAEDVGTIAAVAGLAFGVGEGALLELGADEALADGVGTAADVAETTGKVAGGAVAYGQYEEGNPVGALVDLTALAVPDASKVLDVGPESDVAGAEGLSKALDAFDENVKGGASVNDAYEALTPEQRQLITERVESGGSLSSESVEEGVKAAKVARDFKGDPLNFATDQGIKDPLRKGINAGATDLGLEPASCDG
ncbi:MAG TPA: hypothetical protein VHX88_14905 [Solirubrobacteraceae bacterium]|jgi:uncharacterized protein YukE|nr:hypothetical protein [Solirubrobacteraceae bacterium]